MTRILLVEDHLTFAQALRAVIDLEDDLEVSEIVTRADEAASAATRTQADVALIDLDLPGGSGIDAIRAIRSVRRESRFIVLTALRARLELARAVEAGVSGLLHKSIEMPALLDAVRRVAAGDNLLAPELISELLLTLETARNGRWNARLLRDSLSSRELEILSELAQGKPLAEIADQVHISISTAETHLRNARGKLGASTRLQAVVEAIRLGLVAPPPSPPPDE